MGRYLVLLQLDMPCLIDTHRRLALFWMETEEEETGGWEGKWRIGTGRGKWEGEAVARMYNK